MAAHRREANPVQFFSLGELLIVRLAYLHQQVGVLVKHALAAARHVGMRVQQMLQPCGAGFGRAEDEE